MCLQKKLDKRKKIKPKFQINHFVRFADIKRTFSKSDTTNWSHKSYKNAEIITDTKSAYKVDNLQDHCYEALLKKTELTMKKNKDITKKLNLN